MDTGRDDSAHAGPRWSGSESKVGLAVTSHNASAPVTAGFDKFSTTDRCDFPNVLSNQCDPGSRFQVLVRTADAIAVANCRKEGLIDDNQFADIAVIQYNRSTGAVCFYQVDRNLSVNGVTTLRLRATARARRRG